MVLSNAVMGMKLVRDGKARVFGELRVRVGNKKSRLVPSARDGAGLENRWEKERLFNFRFKKLVNIAAVIVFVTARLLPIARNSCRRITVIDLFFHIDDTPAHPLAQGIEPFGHTTRDIVIRVLLKGRDKQGFQIIQEKDLVIDIQRAVQQFTYNMVIPGPKSWIVENNFLVSCLRQFRPATFPLFGTVDAAVRIT